MEMAIDFEPFFWISLLDFNQTYILIYKNQKKKKGWILKKLPLPYFNWKSINLSLISVIRGADLSILNYNMPGVIFKKFNFIFIFCILYIKMHVWLKSDNEIHKNGSKSMAISISWNYGQICIFGRKFAKWKWP